MNANENTSPKTKLLVELGGLGASVLIRSWMSSMDYRVVYYDRSVDPALSRTPGIYIFWHENILMPLYLRGHCHLAMLLSQHRDADLLSKVADHFGFDCVRGSTNRGGVRALRELLDRSSHMHLTITPDGPRGPRRQLAPGPIYLASRLQMPLILMGFGYNRPWRAKSWDRFAIPKPFSRARAVVSPPVYLPKDMDRDGIEKSRQRAERLLNCLTLEAEAWATAGSRKAGELAVHPQAAAPLPKSDPAEDDVVKLPFSRQTAQVA